MRQHLGVALPQGGDVRFQVREQLGVENHAVLDHLAQAGAVLALGERGQRGRVDQHARGCRNAPTMFLASGRLIPTLPPTELSTWARSVVGTWKKRMPRA